jgi:hypothetical protein
MPTEEFIKKAKEIHGDKYDYSLVDTYSRDEYRRMPIICHKKDKNGKEHGTFLMSLSNHLAGKGCRKCMYEENSKNFSYTQEDFLRESRKTHGDKYDYSKVDMVNRRSDGKVCIICPIHGEFWQLPNLHMFHYGCFLCGTDYVSQLKILTTEEFIKRARKTHGDKYNYDKSNYVFHDVKTIITCPIHGDFEMIPDRHIQGDQCPKCVKKHYVKEDDLCKYIISCIGENNVIDHARGIIDHRYELDVYCPNKKIAFEFDGLFWHSNAIRDDIYYHSNKSNMCFERGINFIHIFEDEYTYKKDILFKIIDDKLNVIHKDLIFSCDYIVKEIDGSINAIEFYYNHSLYDYNNSTTINYGIYLKDKLLAILSVQDLDNNNWLINNIVFDLDYYPIRGKEMLLNKFIEDKQPNTIDYYIDRRYNLFGDNEIEDFGFLPIEITEPNLYYTNKHDRISEQDDIKKCFTYKIYDCGFIHYRL